MNKVGICEWCLPVEGPFGLDFAKSVGFEGVQLGDLAGASKGYPMNNEFIQAGYKEAAARTGMVLHSIHLHTLVSEGGHIYPMDSPKGMAGTESIQKGIDACAALDIHCLNISAFFESYVRNDYDLKNLVDHLNFATSYGKDHDVIIVYEPGVSLDKVLEIMDRVPGLTINYDLLNPLFSGRGDPAVEIPAIGAQRIDHVHIKDVRLDHLGRFTGGACFCGEGGGRLQESIQLLQSQGYDKWYLSEANYAATQSYGIGSDLSSIMQRDVAAIRKLLSCV